MSRPRRFWRVGLAAGHCSGGPRRLRGSFAPELIARGEALAGGGYCAACHTAKGGEKFARGYAMVTPVRRDLFDQYHARFADRHRHLVGSGLQASRA